jgi:hypothetical protein
MVSTELKKEDNRHPLRFNLNCFNRDVISHVDNALCYIDFFNNNED